MLINTVKVKDEEIKQLKRQLGVEEQLSQSSPIRTNVTPLRPSKQSSAGKHDSLRPITLDKS